MKSVGTQLREARHARGWTPKAAAKATKIKEQQILLLEGEDYGKFPAPAYVRGFVRIYAKTLGLNEAKILHELDKVLAIEGEEVYLASSPVHCIPVEPRWKKLLSPRGFAYLFAMAIVAAICTFIAIRVGQILPDVRKKVAATHAEAKAKADAQADKAKKDDTVVVGKAVSADAVPDAPAPKATPVEEPVAVAKAVPAAPADSSAPAAPAAPVSNGATPVAPSASTVAAPAAADNLVLKATDDCFVRVTLLDGGQNKELFSGVMKSGAEQHFSGQKFQLRIAIPAAITAIFNGETYHSDAHSPGDFSLPPGN
ncbi:MAG TPA: RodZ domain-containing protein [Candidatus Methylacidiphilales bacterium]